MFLNVLAKRPGCLLRLGRLGNSSRDIRPHLSPHRVRVGQIGVIAAGIQPYRNIEQ